MNIKEEFAKNAYEKIKQAIIKIDHTIINDIYALSFWFSHEDDELHYPTILFSYNTLSNFKNKIESASSENEAKWNFAYWLQKNFIQIGGEEDKHLANWFKASDYYYTEEENEAAEEDEDLFDEFMEKGEKFSQEFIAIMIETSRKIHEEGIIEKTFGKAIPLIIHELEYYDKPLNWTIEGNPKGLTQEFEDWVNNF